MPTQLLFMKLKIPPRFDLVQPLSKWLDGDQQVGYDGNNMVVENPLPWVVPKPTFKSARCLKDLKRLAALRNCLSEVLQDSHQAALKQRALEDCQEFHAALLEFEKQGFPTLEDELNGIALTWRGAYATKQQETHYSLIYDRACTLWNVAAFQSFIASTSSDLTTREGCKLSISLFQNASNSLGLLRQLVESQDYSTVDLSPSMLQFWEQLFKAQGQWCIYKLANLGDTVRQHTTLASLIQASAAFFNEALISAQDPRLQSEVPRQSQEWATHCKAQSLIAQARAMFHMSIEHRLKKEHGPEVARLRQCVEQLKECHDFQKSASMDYITQEVSGLVTLARDRLVRAEEDNRAVYMDDVPKDLPEIRSQVMIKSNLTLSPELTVTKVPLFTSVKK